jgi:acylphosphatase
VPLHLKVTGTVHGVGFRQFVRITGTRLGLSGWVRNTPDGAVELVASGAPAAEEAMLVAVRRGPSQAHVAAVELVAGNGAASPLPFPFTVRF